MVAGEQDTSAMGHRVVLPSSFPGSPRYFQQLYQDSMAIVGHFGRPLLFIAFTADPNWTEVQDLLRGTGLTAADQPDLVARVYHLKMKAFMEDLRKNHIFGRHMGHCYRIEYQKHGLPHSHLLLFSMKMTTFSTLQLLTRSFVPNFPIDKQILSCTASLQQPWYMVLVVMRTQTAHA